MAFLRNRLIYTKSKKQCYFWMILWLAFKNFLNFGKKLCYTIKCTLLLKKIAAKINIIAGNTNCDVKPHTVNVLGWELFLENLKSISYISLLKYKA